MHRYITHSQRRAAARVTAAGGTPKLAAATSNVSLATIYRWRRDDPEFALLVAEETAKLRRHEFSSMVRRHVGAEA